MAPRSSQIVPPLYWVRKRQIILDSDLASLFGVTTKRLNEQVRRNVRRFPEEFAFRVEASEAAALRSQIATSNVGRGGRRYLPYVFTEHGVVMAANVLNSERAVEMSVEIVRTFIRMRRVIRTSRNLAKRLSRLETAIHRRLAKHDVDIEHLFTAVESLIEEDGEEPADRSRIGFAP